MAIQSLSYLDIPLAKRRSMAAKSVAKIREGLSDSSLTSTQAEKLHERMTQLEKWVAGTLPVSTPSPLQEGT